MGELDTIHSPKEQVRTVISGMLWQAGWAVQDANQVNLGTSRAVAIREFPLRFGYGFADDLLFVNE